MKSMCSRAGTGGMAVAALFLAVLAAAAATAGPAAALTTGTGGWQWQNPLPQGTAINGLFFTTPDKGWLVTDGCIISTTDGGATQRIRAKHNVHLQDVTFVGTHGWAVGYAASGGRVIIYRSTDGGATWSRVATQVKGVLEKVTFVNRNVGWAVGHSVGASGLILKSTDGGRTWVRQRAKFYDIVDIQMRTATSGWLVGGNGHVWRTRNGGATWRAVGPDLGETLRSVSFVSGTVGWVAGWGRIWRTDDGGSSWSLQLDLESSPSYPVDVAFGDAQHGCVVGDGGLIYTTADGGAHWVARTVAGAPDLNRVVALGATSMVAAGDGGRIGRSADGGATWSWTTRTASGSGGTLSHVDFVDENNGWIAGGHAFYDLPAYTAILHTADGGATWTWQNPGTLVPLTSVDFVDATHGWAVGTHGVIVATTNGGVTWTPQVSGATADLTDVYFLDTLHGWACGSYYSATASDGYGVVLRTVDGGAHWTAASPAALQRIVLDGLAFSDATHGWVVGSSANVEDGQPAVILTTSDGGASWASQVSYTPAVSHSIGTAGLDDVAVLGAGKVVAVGSRDNADNTRAIVYRTSDNGATWQRSILPLKWGSGLHAVSFSGGSNGWATGYGMTVATRDGGKTWSRQDLGVSQPLLGVCFVSATRGWACGDYGAILSTTTGGRRP